MTDIEKEENETEEEKSKRVEFVDKVFRFHERRGIPMKRLPMLGGRELDIYHLYHEVQKRGGSEKVTRIRMWGEIARTFNLPSTVTSASYAIRNHFIKLLEQFEAAENGLTLDYDIVSTHSPSPSLSSLPILLPSLPKPLPIVRKTLPLTNTVPLTDVDIAMSRLMCSLMSGLPNELDFAFNTLLILSHSNSLSLQKVPSLLDIALAHVGIFTDDDPGLEVIYRETWFPLNQLDFFAYWEMAVPEWIYSTILKSPTRKNLCDCLLFNKDFTGHPHQNSDEEEEDKEEERMESYRIAQIATVLHNLSTTATVAEEILSNHDGVRRFLVLAMSCDCPSVRIPALDCLTNLAPSLQFYCEENEWVWSTDAALLRSLYNSLLSDDDRYTIKRGMEILGKLSTSQCNLTLLLSLPPAVYTKLFYSLLLPDPELIMIALDSLYYLTLTARDIAHTIGAIHGLIDVLVYLLSFRIESLPQQSLAGIKLFFIGDSASLTNYLADLQTKSKPMTTPTSSSEGAASLSNKPLTTNSSTRPHPQGETGLRGKPVVMTVGSSLQSILTSSSSVKSGSEQFAMEWLKETYAVESVNHLVLLVDMYAQYILHCSSAGRKTFLNNTEFLTVLKCVFPSSQTREVRTVAKKVIHFITGLKRVTSHSKPSVNHTPSLAIPMATDPILKQCTSSVLRSVSSSPPPSSSCPSRDSTPVPSSTSTPTLSQINKLKSLQNDVICHRNDVMENSHLTSSDAHFTATQLPSQSLRNPLSSHSPSPTSSSHSPSPTSSSSVNESSTTTQYVQCPVNTSSVSNGDGRGGKRKLIDGDDDDSSTNDKIPEAKRIKSNCIERQIMCKSNKQQPDATGLTSLTTSSIKFMDKMEESKNCSLSVRPVCLWENCMSMRYSWSDLFHHVINSHISSLPSNSPSSCRWAGCNHVLVRPKPSLTRHLETHHCSPGPKPTPPSVTVTLSRLKHCPPFQNEVESPLTKAVRVTAGLVLRNLCRLAPSTHCMVRKHECWLREMAASNKEAAHALTECLTVLHHPSPLSSTSSPLHHNISTPWLDTLFISHAHILL